MVSAKALLFRLTSLLVVADLVQAQFSLRNVSVDDTDPSIDYQPPGAWIRPNPPTEMAPLDYPFDATSSHHYTKVSGATATFIFTGVGVYFWSPLWPYLVNSLISLDGEPGSCVDLRDYTHDSSVNGAETIASVPVWSRLGLSNTQHTVLVSHCSGGQSTALYVVVDAFTYTVQDIITTSSPSNTPTASATATTTVSSTTTATPSSTSSRRIIAIAVGGGVGGLAILVGLITVFVIVMRSRRARKSDIRSHLDLNDNSAAGSSPSPLLMSNSLYPSVQGDYLSEQYNPNAPYNRWTPMSPGSLYPNTFPPLSEGSPLSVTSQRPDLPEL